MARPGEPSTALRVVIGTILAIGFVLVGILVLRETVKPAWLMPASQAVATTVTITAGPSSVVTVPAMTPPPPPASSEKWSWEVPSASASAVSSGDGAAPLPSSSSAAVAPASARPPPAARPAQRDIVELPDDFQYHPPPGDNLTVPAK